MNASIHLPVNGKLIFASKLSRRRWPAMAPPKYSIPPLVHCCAIHCRAVDQGSQFTSTEFIKVLVAREIKISMDGKGAWRDNVFVERRALVRHWSEDNGRAADHQI